jgi:hypothetical protein
MSTEPEAADDAKWSVWAIAFAALLVVMFGVIAIGTLRGCFFSDPGVTGKNEDEKKKKKEEEEKKKKDKKPEFDIAFPVILPCEPEDPLQGIKPGHWSTASQKMVANYRDFVGDSRVTIIDGQQQPYPIANTPFVERSSRPVLLTKARPKATETTFFVPHTDRPVYLSTELEERGLGFAIGQPRIKLTAMPWYQYHFVVLAKEPSRYSFIKSLDSVKVPFDGETDMDDTEDPVHYRVSLLATGKSVPLPDNSLTWSSIAYILWDEVDPGEPFSAAQKRALVDWLHWGGQIIINGPDSLDLLRGSFLEPYLPATSEGPRTIAPDDAAIDEINRGWKISTPAVPGDALRPTAPWSGITLKAHTDAHELDKTGGLFVERKVGRGRIVVSAVQLSERDLINWRSGFESFFNAGLLRRPPRKYTPGRFTSVTLKWADDKLSNRTRRLDAALITNVRYFARDLGVETALRRNTMHDPSQATQLGPDGELQFDSEYVPPDAAKGVLGGWNDFSKTAVAARGALREAAGVEVPNAGFVVFCLAAYLIALVPLNWLVFHALGRIEWAWIAAPVIAIAGTFVIVQRAQLDIGFVRAQTEIGILEQQPDYSRGHLSRYTALYTSLSTTYDLEFGNLTTLVAPFPPDASNPLLSGQQYVATDFQHYDSVRLAGIPILSNSTGMVHSEQMFDLEGAIAVGKSTATGGRQIVNRSKMELHSVCIVRQPTESDAKNGRTQLEGMWIGDMLPGKSMALPDRMSATKSSFAEDRAAEGKLARVPRLNLEPMFCLALDPKYLEPGETRLVGRIDEVLPGESITPAASQVRAATLVVAHLQYASLSKPHPDVNTRRDIKAQDNEPAESEN